MEVKLTSLPLQLGRHAAHRTPRREVRQSALGGVASERGQGTLKRESERWWWEEEMRCELVRRQSGWGSGK